MTQYTNTGQHGLLTQNWSLNSEYHRVVLVGGLVMFILRGD